MYVPEIVVGIVVGVVGTLAALIAATVIVARSDRKKAQSRKDRENAK